MERSMSNEGNRPEEALTSSEQELRLLVEAIPALVWRAGPDGNIEYVNKRVLEYLGAPLSEVIGWRWMEKVHPDDVAFKVRTWLKNLESGNPHDAVCRIRGADGRYRWFEVRGEPLRASDGTVPSWYGVLIDIDDRKAEEAVRESEYKLRQIIDTVPGLIWSTGPDGEPTHINQRMLDYSGMRFEDFKHVGWKALVHPDDFPESAKAYYHAIQSGTSYQGVVRLRRADGEFRWHHARCEPLRDQQGRIIQWYGLCVDTDEAQLQAILNVIPAYTWYAAPSGALTFVNKRTADYLGLPKDHPLRFGIDVGAQYDAHIPFLHPDDQERSRKAWPENMRTGEASEFSFRVRNAEGGYRWFLSRVEPLRASDGTLLQWVGVNLDIEELKRAEQALRESESNLRQIIDTVPGLLWSIGPDGELTQINQGVLDYSGMRFEDHLGYYKFHHPDDLSDALNAFSHAMQTGTSYQALSRLRRANGEYRWHQVRAQPLRDREGRIVQWYGLSVDIEERKQAEDRLRRSEAYLAEAQRLSHTGSFGWTPSTGELHWSDETFRILEYEPSIMPTIERVLQRIHPDDRAMVRQLLDETSRGEKDFDVTHRLLMPDGSVKFAHVLSHPLKDAAGNLEVVGAVMDVTENSCLYRDLAEREAKIRRFVEANIIGVFVWDLEGRIIEANKAFLRTVGYDREDLVSGRVRWPSLTPPELHENDERTLAELKATGTVQPCEREYLRKDGSRVPVLMGSTLFEESGNEGLAFVLDLTERKRAERDVKLGTEALREMRLQLEHANRLATMGQLTASIAHEVNQPIGASVTNAQAALRWLVGPKPDLEEARQALGRIVRDGHRAGAVVGRIRDLVKKAPPRKDLVEINSAIREIIEVARNEALKNGVSVHTELAEDLPVIHRDRVELQQVLLNLIINAVEAMRDMSEEPRDVLIMSAKTEADEVLVSVRDSGPGLAPAIRDSLFKAFQTTKPSGLGLGLSICRSIIESHGGRLWASANAPRGAIFQFTLPAETVAPKPEENRAHAPAVISPATSGLDPSADRVLSRKAS